MAMYGNHDPEFATKATPTGYKAKSGDMEQKDVKEKPDDGKRNGEEISAVDSIKEGSSSTAS